MKKLSVFCAAMFALSVSGELLAQTRGPRYNPGGGGSSSSGSRSSSSSSSPSRSSSSGSSSSGSSRGPSYNPSRSSSSSSSSSSSPSRGSSYNPSRSSSSSSSSSSSPSRGSNYNPSRSSSSSSGSSYSSGSSSSSSGSSYSSGSSSSSSYSSPSRGSNYNPTPRTSSSSTYTQQQESAPRGPRYNPNPARSTVSSTGTAQVPRGPRYNPAPGPRYPAHQQVSNTVLVRRRYAHAPRLVIHHPIRWATPYDYYFHVNRRYIYRSWIQEPVSWNYYNGYWDFDGYPYYVHRGYRYRYSPVEMCQYELVDGDNYSVVKTYPQEACTTAYDTCAAERDTMNSTISVERYFCAERVNKELEQQPTEVFQGSAIELTEAQKAEIDTFLDDKDFMDVFYDGRNGELSKCAIYKNGGLFSSGNEFGCRWSVKVGEQNFPMTDGSVCSDDASAEDVGCNVGNEKENAGCILQQAIQAGLCL